MKRLLWLIGPMILSSCGGLEIPNDNAQQDNGPDFTTHTITFPCNKFNGSSEWQYCTGVRVDLSQYQGVRDARMSYVLVTTRKSSYMIAELYDLTNDKSILLSQVNSNTDSPGDFKFKSQNILDYIPNEPVELIIRFKNSEDGPEGYINNTSYLTLTLDR